MRRHLAVFVRAKACIKTAVLSLFFIWEMRPAFGPVIEGGQPLRGCAIAGVMPVLAGGFSGVHERPGSVRFGQGLVLEGREAPWGL